MAPVRVSFTLDSKRDRDLVNWIDSLPPGKKSEVIRETLRVGLDRAGVTLGDVYQAVKDLERRIEVGVVLTPGVSEAAGWPDEPPEAAAALDALANL